MKPLTMVILLIVILTYAIYFQTKDRNAQCDGKTKIYASLGKAYACENYQEPQSNGEQR